MLKKEEVKFVVKGEKSENPAEEHKEESKGETSKD